MTTRSEDWNYAHNTIAASYQNTVRIVLRAHAQRARSKTQVLRTGHHAGLSVWNPDTGKIIKTLSASGVMSLAVLGDDLIGVGARHGELMILNATSGNKVVEFHGGVLALRCRQQC